MMWTKLILVLLSAYFVWQLFRYVRANPGAFSKANLNRSFVTLGGLAILLIGFVALLVSIVK